MNEQEDKNRVRILNIELALFGMWDMENMALSYFFMPNNDLEILIGGGLPISRDITYEIFIKENDPFIRVVNPHAPGDKTQELVYELLEVDTNTGVLRLRNQLAKELKFTKHRV